VHRSTPWRFAPPPLAGHRLAMDLSLPRELERSLYVRTGLGRATALRVAYLAYAATLARGLPRRPKPEALASLRRRMEALFDRDFEDAALGLYPRALLGELPWRDYLRALPALLADLPRTRERIREERFDDLPGGAAGRYPRYYARNFHFQTDGYLGHTSARLYDLQVEMLFGGTADVMRRRMIPRVVEEARARLARGAVPRVLDVACGTGRLLSMLGAALPQASFTGVDLSPHYIAHARRALGPQLDVSLLVENAERLPFEDGRFDAVTCLFLFHELPRDVGLRVLAECARVVRPGGCVVLGDSLQLLDAPELEAELRAFPDRFHEPYYLGYVQDDLSMRASEAGLSVESAAAWFLTKVVAARKPG
jgi:ubiquinone/menaquinone biosynthesis C-methylase UbiE